MKTEERLWTKRFLVLRPVPGLLIPTDMSLAQANCTIYRNRGAARNPKFKDTFVFQYTLSGRGIFERDGQKYALPAGTAFFCNVTAPNTVYYYPDDASEPWRFIYLTICDTTGCAAAVNASFGYVFEIDPSEPQIQLLLSYRDVPERSIQIDAGAAHVFANTLIGMLVDQAQSEVRSKGASLRVAKKALDIIEINIGKPLNAALLAKMTGVSQEYLNRTFRDELGRTPYHCICDAKMHRACELLKGTDQTITNIAAQLGYEPDSHFTRLFKRVIGVTPGRYRSGASMPMHRRHHD